jgi:hypothetical protein
MPARKEAMNHPEELRMLVKLESRSRDYTDKAMLSAADEIEKLRVDAARYLWLNADGDRCAQVVADAYSDWDTDIAWEEHFDAAVTEAMRCADACMFPDCGCDGARLCMAKNGANSAAMVLNISRRK